MIAMTCNGVSFIAGLKSGKTSYEGRANTPEAALEALVDVVEKDAARGSEDALALRETIRTTPGMEAAWQEIVAANEAEKAAAQARRRRRPEAQAKRRRR